MFVIQIHAIEVLTDAHGPISYKDIHEKGDVWSYGEIKQAVNGLVKEGLVDRWNTTAGPRFTINAKAYSLIDNVLRALQRRNS